LFHIEVFIKEGVLIIEKEMEESEDEENMMVDNYLIKVKINCFLFNDLLLFGIHNQQDDQKLCYEISFDLSTTWIFPDGNLSFRIINPRSTHYKFDATSTKERNEWTNIIKNAITELIKSNPQAEELRKKVRVWKTKNGLYRCKINRRFCKKN